MLSGPEALPVFKDFKTVSTSYGVNWTESSILLLWDDIGILEYYYHLKYSVKRKIHLKVQLYLYYRNK